MKKLTFLLGFLLVACQVGADDLRPLVIEILSDSEGMVQSRITLPPQVNPYNRPTLVFPESCQSNQSESGVRLRSALQCSEPLDGATLRLQYPMAPASLPGVVRWTTGGGNTRLLTLGPGQFTWRLPVADEDDRTLVEYIRLGVEHIWIGFDHLLFLVCLVWIAGSLPRILLTVTGFTVAHSVTLALATLEVVRLPIPWIEAVIALSVVFLAAEVVRGKDDTLTWRFPLAVSMLFGLLHGLGFAAVLGEIGLPEDELLVGLIGFNLGVELGQVAFILGCVGVLTILNQLTVKLAVKEALLSRSAGYLVGIIAGCWFLDRVVGFVA